MKPLLLFLVVYNFNAIAQSHDHDKESALFKSFPKKVHQSQMLNPKLINSARYIKTAPPVEKSKRPNSDDAYTVFPKVSKIVPDSPYFPIDLDFFHKHREKKILPRSKRSAPSPNSPPAKVMKLVETVKPMAVKADSKPKTEKPKVNAKVNKPKAAVEPKKGTVNQANKPVPKLANPAKKGSKPVGRKRVSRKGVLPKGKKNSDPKKVSVPRKISRQGAKKTAHKVSSSKHPKGASHKRHRHLRSGNRSRKHTGKGPKPGLPVKGKNITF